MKNLFWLLVLFASFTANAGSLLNYGEFIKLSDRQKVDVVIAYKNFLASQNMPLGDDEKVTSFFHLIPEAFAAAGDDCFFAGWPSKVRAAGGKQFCTSPANANPDYQSQASKCSGSQMLCNPVLFGEVGCVNAATQAQKNLAFSSCEQKFKASGKSIAEVAASLSQQDKRSAAEAMFATADKVCGAGGFQASKPMCRNLSAKVASIKSAAPAVQAVAVAAVPATPEVVAAVPAAVAATAAAVVTPQPEVQAGQPVVAQPVTEERTTRPEDPGIKIVVDVLSGDPSHVLQPGEICEDANHIHRRPASENDFKKVSCGETSLEGVPATNAELVAELEANGIVFLDDAAKNDTENLRKFVSNLRKFPEALRKEIKDRGGRVLLINGEGVETDPSFPKQPDPTPEQAHRLSQGSQYAWSKTPGSGGFIASSRKEPTRIVINHLYDRHGSQNLFLHEHAHTMDSFGGKHSISESTLWKQIREGNGPGASPDEKANIEKLLSVYSHDGYTGTFTGEAFAELFANYHACDASRDQLKTVAPSVAKFFEELGSLEAFQRKESAAKRRAILP